MAGWAGWSYLLDKRSLDLTARCERANIYRMFSPTGLAGLAGLVRKEP